MSHILTARKIIVALASALLLAGLTPEAAAQASATAGPTPAARPSTAEPDKRTAPAALSSAAELGKRIAPAALSSTAELGKRTALAAWPSTTELDMRTAPADRPSAAELDMRTAPADRPSAAELDRRITAAARELEVLVERYNDSREDLKATRTQTMHLGGQLGPMTRNLAKRQEMMGGLVSRTYQRTRSGPTIALFAADEPHQFVDKLLVLHQLAAEEQRAAAELREARTRVNDTRTMLNALAAQQRRQQMQLSTRKATVEGEITALKQMRAIAYGGGSRYPAGEDMPLPEYVPGPAGQVVAFAFNQLGKPYRWGAAGPRSYDCSGLTLAAWHAAGVGLPHNAARQYRSTAHVSRAQLRPGDLVFFYGPVSHVGVYIGGDKMIHAPEYGENVRVASIDTQPIHGFGRPS